MQEQHMRRAQMVSPAPGFTARVMARVAEAEHARARRRALIGAGLLAAAAVASLLIVALLLVITVTALISDPGMISSAIDPVVSSAGTVGAMAEAVWLAANVVAEYAVLPPVLFALMVLVLTLVWFRVVGSVFQRPIARSMGEAS